MSGSTLAGALLGAGYVAHAVTTSFIGRRLLAAVLKRRSR